MASMRNRVTEYIQNLQEAIVSALQSADPDAPPFKVGSWSRNEGGSGKACTFSSLNSPTSVLEKAAVNISMIKGKLPPAAIKQMATEHSSVKYSDDLSASLPFFAGGISIIIHPRNPNVPSAHANYRYFEITESEETDSPKVKAWWFGGITDLTPSYVFEDDFRHFHRTLKEASDPYGPDLYPAFKKCCDEYFFIKHRDEHRGIGGIRFDDLCEDPHSLLNHSTAPRPKTADEIFSFIQSLGNAFIPSFIPIVIRRSQSEWTEEMRRWQLLRRGRYIEFNLVYDRGTRFGLATPGVQAENVLASLPEEARWEYMSDAGLEDDSKEGEMIAILKNPKDWAVS